MNNTRKANQLRAILEEGHNLFRSSHHKNKELGVYLDPAAAAEDHTPEG